VVEKKVIDKEKAKEDKRNRVCHYCGEIIYNALSDSSDCYVDSNEFWYCSVEEYAEYREVKSFF